MAAAHSLIWIDYKEPLNRDLKRQVRRHIMLHHVKKQRIQQWTEDQHNVAPTLPLRRTSSAIASGNGSTPPPLGLSDNKVGQEQGVVMQTSQVPYEGLDGHLMDPFDTLSVRSTAETDDLIRWCFVTPFLHRGARSATFDEAWRRSALDLAWQYELMFYTLLCASLVKRSVAIRVEAENPSYFYYKGKALKAIRAQLTGMPCCTCVRISTLTGVQDYSANTDSHVLISAILQQAHMSLTDDAGVLASHYNAVQRLTALMTTSARGLHNESYVDWRFAILTDHDMAVTSHRMPWLPYLKFATPVPLPDCFHTNLHNLTAATLASFRSVPSDTIGIYRIFSRLHSFLLLFAPDLDPETAIVERYSTIYKSCVDVAGVRSDRDGSASLTVYDTIVLTSLVFILTMYSSYRQAQFRHIPGWRKRCRSTTIAITRLHTALVRNDDLVHTWRDTGLAPLLWCLSLVTVNALQLNVDYSIKTWFLENLQKTASQLGIYTIIDFTATLEPFPWAQNGIFDSCHEVLWECIQGTQPLSGFLYAADTFRRPTLNFIQRRASLGTRESSDVLDMAWMMNNYFLKPPISLSRMLPAHDEASMHELFARHISAFPGSSSQSCQRWSSDDASQLTSVNTISNLDDTGPVCGAIAMTVERPLRGN